MPFVLPRFLGAPRELPTEPILKSLWNSIKSDTPFGEDVDFSMMVQDATNWCWSAVAQAVRYHFVRERELTQAEIATAHVRRTRPTEICYADQGDTNGGECEVDACTKPCNGLHKVRVVLVHSGLRVGKLSDGRAVTFVRIQEEVRAGAPIVCRIEFGGNFGHFVCVSGWRIRNGVQEVNVHDPKRGARGMPAQARWIPYAEFVGHYVVQGSVGRNNMAYSVRYP